MQLGQVDIPDKYQRFADYLHAMKEITALNQHLNNDELSNDNEFPADVYQWQKNFTREIMSVPMVATFLTNNNLPDEPEYDFISTIHEPFIMTCLHGTNECKLDHLIKYRDPNFLVCYRYDPNKEYGSGSNRMMDVLQGVANGISMVLLTGVAMLNADKLKGPDAATGAFSQTAHAASPTSGADGIRVMIHQSGKMIIMIMVVWI